jgi:hypothetical protein
MQERGVPKIQNHRHVIFSNAAQLPMVAPRILDLGRIVLNFISYRNRIRLLF